MDEVILRAQRGERDAMAEIVGVYYDAVYRFCAHRIGAQAAQDITQDTFVTAQKEMKRFEQRSSLKTWLLGIANNHCRAHSRRRKLDSEAWLEDHAVGSPEPNAIDRTVLVEALRSLSEAHREVVLLHEVEGLTYDEAAEVIGVPSGTVKSRLHHAFLQLRELLRECEEATT